MSGNLNRCAVLGGVASFAGDLAACIHGKACDLTVITATIVGAEVPTEAQVY